MFRHGPFPQWPERLIFLWHRFHACRRLRRALKHEYVKVAHGHALICLATSLGYQPKIILSTRDFQGYLKSRAPALSHMLHSHIVEDYHDALSHGRMAMQAFGGIEIDFAELTDPDETDWAERLGSLCGIAPSALCAARDRTLKPKREETRHRLNLAVANSPRSSRTSPA